MEEESKVRVKIKICGLTKEADIETVNQCMPDYIGFIFVKKSRRFIDYNNAMHLKQKLNPKIKSVGVFVDEKIEKIEESVSNGIIDVIQLHGEESGDYIEELQKRCRLPVWKAYGIREMEDIHIAVKSKADMILLDSVSGGTGVPFDWNLISKIDRPFFLAGGLQIANVSEAIKRISPYGIDVSSGVETNGQKDPEKINNMVMIVRGKRIENHLHVS